MVFGQNHVQGDWSGQCLYSLFCPRTFPLNILDFFPDVVDFSPEPGRFYLNILEFMPEHAELLP